MEKEKLPKLKNKYELLPEEQELEDAIERGEYVRLSAAEEEEMKKILSGAARNYLRKDKRINIRLSSFDLNQLKAKAAREGLPYQTMIASILHKVATGQWDDKLARKE